MAKGGGKSFADMWTDLNPAASSDADDTRLRAYSFKNASEHHQFCVDHTKQSKQSIKIDVCKKWVVWFEVRADTQSCCALRRVARTRASISHTLAFHLCSAR